MTETLKPCPFCGRNMKYKEIQCAFVWDVFIEHDYDKSKLYIPCPMAFYTHIPWKDRLSGEVFNEDWVKRKKEQFIESWNRRTDDDADLLALFNGWLDSERYNCDNSEHD